ncbi:MAG: carbonic anhydrase family protein [Phycisphaerales bacterium]
MNRTSNRSNALLLATLGAAFALAGCANQPALVSDTTTQAEQQAMTPDQALAHLKEGNARFVSGKSERRDFPAQVRATSKGQYPFAVVLSCIDSRSAPEIVFDQGLGDLFVPRVAGNYMQADLLGSTEFATKVAGAKLVVVMGHTECGAVKGACDNVQLGNLTTVIDAIRPAVNAVQNVPGARDSHNGPFVLAVTEENVRLNVEKVRTDSPILRDLEKSGQIKVVGAMHNIATGEVVFLN